MQKPITLICQEFMEDVSKVIQKSELPACIILSMLHDISNNIELIAKKQYERDLNMYNQSLKNGEGNDGKPNDK